MTDERGAYEDGYRDGSRDVRFAATPDGAYQEGYLHGAGFVLAMVERETKKKQNYIRRAILFTQERFLQSRAQADVESTDEPRPRYNIQ